MLWSESLTIGTCELADLPQWELVQC
eukprot:COSAG02_NODE_25010_length_671_cov_0.926573_1_plen_25_part_01